MDLSEAKKCLERRIKAQVKKVNAMDPLDENYQKEIAVLMALYVCFS